MTKTAAALRTCMICGRTITARFSLCAGCERKHGLSGPWQNWPEWARQLHTDHERQRYSERRRLGYEVSASALDDEDDGQRGGELAACDTKGWYDRVVYGEWNDDAF